MSMKQRQLAELETRIIDHLQRLYLMWTFSSCAPRLSN